MPKEENLSVNKTTKDWGVLIKRGLNNNACHAAICFTVHDRIYKKLRQISF